MDFIKKVQSMTGKEIVTAMIDGLKKEWVQVEMSTFGYASLGICYGCAATNAICQIIEKPFTVNGITGEYNKSDFIGNHKNLNKRDILAEFISGFETAIDGLRSGDIHDYNYQAKSYGFAKLPHDTDLYLPPLTTEDYKELLHCYEEYRDSLPD